METMKFKPIHKLPQDVVGKIAAGEVVERPAAAVKELVENAIDAGAAAVTVELVDGGITSIRVSDNGTGIPAGQMKMAFERHATNKLGTAEELHHVHTLGFRGEALASHCGGVQSDVHVENGRSGIRHEGTSRWRCVYGFQGGRQSCWYDFCSEGLVF